MAFRVDDTTVALTTDDGFHLLHLGGYVHLTHSRSVVSTTILVGHVTQCTGRTQVRNRVARCVLQHIVGYSYQGVLLAIHTTILTDEGQTVHVRIYYEAHIVVSASHKVHDIAQVLLQRLRIMLEVACNLSIKQIDGLHAQFLQQPWKDDATYRVDGVQRHLEIGIADSLHIHQFQAQHMIYMFLIEAEIFLVFSNTVHIRIHELFCLGYPQHFVTFGCVQELAFLV